jgi:hypothetical protein
MLRIAGRTMKLQSGFRASSFETLGFAKLLRTRK